MEALAEKREMNSCSSGLLHLPDHQLAGLVPEIVVSGVELNFAIVDVRDLGTDLIQEIAVVGDHDDGVREIDQELLQPGDGVQIQVVRGLVEQQDVGISEQGLGQQHLDLLSAQQILHQRIMKLCLDAEAV